MKVKELIELLKNMPQNLEVYSICDHGQSPEKSAHPTIAYAKAIEYSLYDDGWSNYEDEAKDEGYEQQFVLL